MEIKKAPLLGFDINKTITISSGFVIIEDNKVLLARGKDHDYFKFPGGTVNDNESFLDAAIREAKEEINCDVKDLGKEPIFYMLIIENNQYLLIHFTGQIVSGTPTPSSEIEELKWFDLDNIPENTFDNVKIALKAL